MANSNNRCVISLPSQTYAMSAQRLLNDNGISSRVVKTDPSSTKKGCSNGIELECPLSPKAKRILVDHSIPVS